MSQEEQNRYATEWHLWALGVGAVIGGNFFGWQAGLAGGFVGLLLNLLPVTILYTLLSCCITELSTTVPVTGGPYIFALRFLGLRSAFIAGMAEVLKVVVTCAVVVVGIGSYIVTLLDMDAESNHWLPPICWMVTYILFVTLNGLGAKQTFYFQLFATISSVLTLVVFFVCAIGKVDYQRWVVQEGNWILPSGAEGVFRVLPFAMWFFLGIEELPLAVEETMEPVKERIPRGLLSAGLTLFILAVCTVCFSSMVSPGAKAVSESDSPLLLGFESILGDGLIVSMLKWFIIIGLLCSFHSFVYCMGQLLHAMASGIEYDGLSNFQISFLPKALAWRHPTRGSALAALIVGAAIGFVTVVLFYIMVSFDEARLGAVLINLALIGALVSYGFQFAAFLKLQKVKTIEESSDAYCSPFGSAGAYVGLAVVIFMLSVIIYFSLFDNNTDQMASFIASLVYFSISIMYYAVAVQPKLKSSFLLLEETIETENVMQTE